MADVASRHLQRSVVLFLLKAQSGVGAGPVNVCAAHWPVMAVGLSITSVAVSGSAAGATASGACAPVTTTLRTPGVFALVLSDTFVMPMKPSLLLKLHDVGCADHPAPPGIVTSSTDEPSARDSRRRTPFVAGSIAGLV